MKRWIRRTLRKFLGIDDESHHIFRHEGEIKKLNERISLLEKKELKLKKTSDKLAGREIECFLNNIKSIGSTAL